MHFIDGKPAFDIRVSGKVSRLTGPDQVKGEVKIEVHVSKETITLSVNGKQVAQAKSPGLIPAQPKDPLSVGQDALSTAGDYQAPNPFNGTVRNTRVEAGGEPPAVAEIMPRAEIEAGLSNHDRSVFVHNSWIRDPYITAGSDGADYLTGTTPDTGDPRESSDPCNSGPRNESLMGSQANVWRSSDLIDWDKLDAPFTLKDGIWFAKQPEAFESTPKNQCRLWAPELHWLERKNRWALIHTRPSPVQGANLALSAGIDVTGPWSHPLGEKIVRRHDPSRFKDDDDIWWLVRGAAFPLPRSCGRKRKTGVPPPQWTVTHMITPYNIHR